MSDGVDEAYDDLINAVFEVTYEDLVNAYRKERSAAQALRYAYTPAKKNGAEYELRNAIQKIEYYSNWLREVLPQWRNLDAEKIIERARWVANNEVD